ncbi:hypothetical protein PybrP1_004547 [[Pythium] brassicae (nom. inval.)]|nr:hypothetical protein PybrP1_004547 [[Pythium] brassicae (nom. inval.)]
MAADFGLLESDLFGGVGDAGSDVTWMVSTWLGWLCEWCLVHLTNTATKHAFGLEPKGTSKNPDMTELVGSIRITVSTDGAVNHVASTSVSGARLCHRAHAGAVGAARVVIL